ncbi:dihydrolipoyl dehydrogenase [Sporanaerobacter acetigenes]|uniref:dihydrolipoyl dehydrogenase n=1 Tax=Sporanaerobacter acetigenes TaxID=165813 RepID=UPI00104DB4F5|nr:dihydrolipoyl dehydrogenase [Sporanaerobacter acetigenes]
MATEVIMPKAGMDMQEGQIIKWYKKEGEYVEKGEVLLEIMTDKVNMEVEAETSGYLLKILKHDGETVPVITTIGYLGEKGEIIKDAGNNEVAKEEVKAPETKVEKDDDIYDVIVIGGGPAGYVAAIRAAQLGGKVAIVEKSLLGGTCLNRGCVPTKTYLKNAEIVEEIKAAGRRGVVLENSNVSVDMDRTVELKNEVVMTLTNGVVGLLKSNGIAIYKGIGKITKDKKVSVNDSEIIEGRKIILAGGSKVAKIKIPGIESRLVLTSDEMLNLKEVPKELAVIGGGVIGVELGLAFNSFGSHVTIVEMMDRIVPNMDKDVSTALHDALTSKGIEIHTSTKLNEIIEKNGKLTLKLEGKEDLVVDKALLSIGRVPDLAGIGEVEFEMERGRIKVNDYMETSVEGIYAPGDINGRKMLAHAAFKMGEAAAINAMGGSEKVKLGNTPAAIYTMPEASSVGLTEDEAREKYDISVGKFTFIGNGRALASGQTTGFVKVIVDKKYGEILGVHMVGPGVAEMINEAAALMEMEITVHEVLQTVHGHPTYSEAFVEACADTLGKAIHLPKKN